jgi:hypothetical protein
MRFPFVLIPQLTGRQQQRFHNHMNTARSGWHRKWTESIWRRHQHPSNAALSGWRRETDRRRRLIHFYDEYDVIGQSFCLRNAYLSLNISNTEDEVDAYWSALHECLAAGKWRAAGTRSGFAEWRLGDLVAYVGLLRTHPEDEKRGRTFPSNYRHLEIRLQTDGYSLPHGLEERPWRWFYDVGLREIFPKGAPTVIQPEEIADSCRHSWSWAAAHRPKRGSLLCRPFTASTAFQILIFPLCFALQKTPCWICLRRQRRNIAR